MATPIAPAADSLEKQAQGLNAEVNKFKESQIRSGNQNPAEPELSPVFFDKYQERVDQLVGAAGQSISDAVSQHFNSQFAALKDATFTKKFWDAGIDSIAAANPGNSTLQDLLKEIKSNAASEQIKSMQRSTTNQSGDLKEKSLMERANAAYGINEREMKLHKRQGKDLDNTALEESQFAISGSPKAGLTDGFYRRDGSNFILTVKDGSVTANLDIDVKKKKWLWEMFFPTKAKFKDHVGETMDLLAVQGGCKTVTYDVKLTERTVFNSTNVQEIRDFIAVARDKLETRKKTGIGAVVDCELGPTAETLLRQAPWIVASKSEKAQIFASLDALNRDVAEFRKSPAFTAGAPAQAPATPGVAAGATAPATPTAAAATPPVTPTVAVVTPPATPAATAATQTAAASTTHPAPSGTPIDSRYGGGSTNPSSGAGIGGFDAESDDINFHNVFGANESSSSASQSAGLDESGRPRLADESVGGIDAEENDEDNDEDEDKSADLGGIELEEDNDDENSNSHRLSPGH